MKANWDNQTYLNADGTPIDSKTVMLNDDATAAPAPTADDKLQKGLDTTEKVVGFLGKAGESLGGLFSGIGKKKHKGGATTDSGTKGGEQDYKPKSDDTILGMSKPIFFGLTAGVVILAGVGIYFAMSGGSTAPTAAPAKK